MATKKKIKAAALIRKRRRKRAAAKQATARKATRKNPGELSSILFANGGGMKKRKRRRRRPAGSLRMTQKKLRRVGRRARRNPAMDLADLAMGAVAAAGGAVTARFVQNFAAIKMAKDGSGQRIADPVKAKAQAGQIPFIAMGAAVPIAIGCALKYGAKQHTLGNGLIAGGIAHAAEQLIASALASTATPASPLYPLAGALEGDALGQLQPATLRASDGSEWFEHPEKGWLRVFNSPPAQRQLGSYEDPGRDLAGLEVQDTLGSYEDPGRDLAGLEVQDTLGSYEDPGRDLSGFEVQDTLGSYEDPGRDLSGFEVQDQLGTIPTRPNFVRVRNISTGLFQWVPKRLWERQIQHARARCDLRGDEELSGLETQDYLGAPYGAHYEDE